MERANPRRERTRAPFLRWSKRARRAPREDVRGRRRGVEDRVAYPRVVAPVPDASSRTDSGPVGSRPNSTADTSYDDIFQRVQVPADSGPPGLPSRIRRPTSLTRSGSRSPSAPSRRTRSTRPPPPARPRPAPPPAPPRRARPRRRARPGLVVRVEGPAGASRIIAPPRVPVAKHAPGSPPRKSASASASRGASGGAAGAALVPGSDNEPPHAHRKLDVDGRVRREHASGSVPSANIGGSLRAPRCTICAGTSPGRSRGRDAPAGLARRS